MPSAGCPQAVCFDAEDDTVISAGNENVVLHWKKSGQVLARVAARSPSLFSLTTATVPVNGGRQPVLVATGVGKSFDVYTNPFIPGIALEFE